MVLSRKPNICAYFMVLQETDNCVAWQHRSRKYLMRCQTAKGRDPRSEWDTVIDVLEQHCPKPCKTRNNFRHNSSFAEFNFVTPNAHISSKRASLSLIADNEAVIKMVIERPEPWHETRFQNPQSSSWLIVRSHQPWESHSRQIREHRPTDCWCVTLGFFIARALDAIDTPSWFHDTSNALLQPLCGIFILSRQEHVEAGRSNAWWASISKIKANTWTLSSKKKRWMTSDQKERSRKLHAEGILKVKNRKIPQATKFGDTTTADRKVLNEDNESPLHHRHAVVAQDLATRWTQSYPCRNKTEKCAAIFISRKQA